jgi:hypothetical protein
MKKLVLLSSILCLSFLLFGCWNNDNEIGIPEDELPEESPVCPEGFYWFESVKSCIMMENAQIEED